MRHFFILLSIIGLYPVNYVHAEEGGGKPKVATYGKAFRGAEGLVLWTLGVGDPAAQEYLLQYSGINHPWDLKIFKAKRVDSRKEGGDYVVKVNGEDYVTVVERPYWGAEKSYEVYLPQGPNGQGVVYDEALSRQMHPEVFLNDYLKQLNP